MKLNATANAPKSRGANVRAATSGGIRFDALDATWSSKYATPLDSEVRGRIESRTVGAATATRVTRG
jgi:hypothetical protein